MATKGRKNVVFFGSARAGKSSLINLLLGKYAAEVSNESVGCTLEHNKYSDENFNFFDTAGLNEASEGSLTPKEAIKNLVSLLKSLKSGVNLLVHVWEHSCAPTESMEKNYKLFSQAICDAEVPVILAITHCETTNDMDKWCQDNRGRFERAGMHFADIIPVCGTDGRGKGSPNVIKSLLPVLRENYQASREPLLKSIEKNALQTGWVMSFEIWIVKAFKNLVNMFWKSLGWGPFFTDFVHYLMTTFGFTKELAEQVNEAYEEATA